MSSFMAFKSRRISLAEYSHSSFPLVYLFCAGEDLPPSGDADEGCQWNVQTDEGCVPYWTHKLRGVEDDIIL
jgi:hypothetical protein